jgi:hypothetical protein
LSEFEQARGLGVYDRHTGIFARSFVLLGSNTRADFYEHALLPSGRRGSAAQVRIVLAGFVTTLRVLLPTANRLADGARAAGPIG